MSQQQVLIVGAGPTGLVLATWLTRLGVPVRLIDKAEAPGTTSRALAVQARTLELYRQIGLAEAVQQAGAPVTAVNLWARGRHAARVPVGEIGRGVSPFPFVLILPQDQHERLLSQRLAEAGVEVERGVELTGFTQTPEGVSAQLKRAKGAKETCKAAWIAGCDGARSAVRQAMGVGFAGGTYQHLFYVADVSAKGQVMDHELHFAFDESDFLGVFPLKQDGTARLVGTVRGEPADRQLGWDDVSAEVIGRMGIEVEQVNWFSTYHVHHRVAERFREGRAFLLGDAAHIHSPVGGQGMNTGIGDAVNLAWKLAAALQGRADAKILDSYEPERIAFARRLVATTDQAFALVTAPQGLQRTAGLNLAARLLPALTKGEAARRFLFKTVSQTAVHYPKSPLSRGAAGRVAGGDRLAWAGPDSGPAGGDNFTPLASLDWQVHVYGAASSELQDACAAWGLPLREFPWRESFWRAGLMQDALYLVRPDGYVALADPNARVAALERFVDDWSLKARPPSREPGARSRARKRAPAPRKKAGQDADAPARRRSSSAGGRPAEGQDGGS